MLGVDDFDARLADNDFQICGRKLGRQLNWNGGKINFSMDRPENEVRHIGFNIERTPTSKDELIGWLQTSAEQIELVVKSIATNTLEIDLEADD